MKHTNRFLRIMRRGLIEFMRYTFGIWLRVKYNVHVKNNEVLKEIKGPFLVLPNHVSTFDPLFIMMGTKRIIRWVASEHLFRRPFFKFMFLWAGTIPKSKAVSDLGTVDNIITAIEEGYPVGLFPEGTMSWTGKTLPLFPATSKLLRLLKVPVVTVHLKGGYLSLPRWAWKRRRGRLEIEYNILISQEEAGKLKLSEITRRLQENLAYDEFEWQAEEKIKFKGKRRAEYLENILFTCPKCQHLATMRSNKNNFYCTHCDYSLELDEYFFFKARSGELIYSSIYEWDKWQREYLEEKTAFLTQGEPIFIDSGIKMKRSHERKMLKKIGVGEARLYPDRIEFKPQDGSMVVIPMEELKAPHVITKQHLEFYRESFRYRLTPTDHHTSMYKWLKVLESLKEQAEEAENTSEAEQE